MPICIKSSTSCTDLTNQASTEIDNHISEAAKVKRNREQAYFNSYDFDAIATKPYITHDIIQDHDVTDDVKKVNRNLSYSQPKTTTKSNPHIQLQTYQHNHHLHAFSTGHSLHGNNNNNNVTILGKHSYLPHYNNSSNSSTSNSNKFLNHSHRASRSSISSSNNSYNSTITDKCQYNNNNNEQTPAITATIITTTATITQQLDTIYASETSLTTKPTINDNNNKNTFKEGTTVYSSSNRQTDSLADVTATDNNSNSKSNKNGFLLPRAMLKHQSVGILNTMPLAATINVSTTPPPLPTEAAQAVIEVDIGSFKTLSTPLSPISPPLPLSAPLVTTSNQTGSSSSLNSLSKSNEKTTKLKIIQNNNGDNVTGNLDSKINNNNNNNSNANNVMTVSSSVSNAGSKTRLAAYNHQYQLHRYGHSNSPDKKTGFTSTTIKTTDSRLNHNLYSNDDYTPSNYKSFNTMKHKKILSSTSTGQHNSVTIDNNSTSCSSRNAINLPPIHEIKVRGHHQPFDQQQAITTTTTPDTKICRYGTGVNGLEHGSTLSHQSHYSTDKSGGGSSGYYSSNVCSTYSLMEEEEHIYSEPTATSTLTRTLNQESHNIIGVLDVRNERKKKKQNFSPNKGHYDKKIPNNPDRHKHPVPKVGHSRHITHHDKFTSLTLPEKISAIRVLPTTSRSQCLNAVVVVKEEEEENKSENNDNANNESGDVHYQMKTNSNSNSNNIKRITVTPTIETTATVLAKEEGNFGDNLKKLEHSIENLDRHLKKFQSFPPNQQQISQGQQQTPHHQQQQQLQQHYITNCCSAAYATPSVHIGKKIIPPDCLLNINANDDSLLDIDFDSFLLKRDAKSKTQPNILNPLSAEGNGLNNATFLTAEQEENHLKCAKYINSCPEDAYQVDSDILVHSRGSTESEQSLNENIAISKQLKAKPAHFPQCYEDQVHFQSTRELLEDVREKIRLFTTYKNSSSPTLSFTDDSPSLVATPTNIDQCEDYVPKELTCMIKTLKHELELYLERLNQHNEIEIRQLCTGLVKNRNILKMRRALGTRCFSSSLSNGDFRDCVTYEAIKDNEFKNTAISKPQPITSLRCSISDPNFKMKRKSLAEVFSIPDAIEVNTSQTIPASIPGGICQSNTQLQRNLSYQQSKLRKLENYHKTQHDLATEKSNPSGDGTCATKHLKNLTMLSDWHRKKPSIWELYYGSNRLQQTLLGKRDSCTGDGGVDGCSGMDNGHNGNNHLILAHTTNPLCYPSSRPESDFTLDLPRAEQLRLKMDKEKKFRQRCRLITTFLSLVFFLLTVMVVSLVLTRGKRMFGSMI